MTARLEPGQQAPVFSLTDDAGQTVSLADFAGRKVIVYFYPAAMTPGCTKQACDFSESLDSLRKDGYEPAGRDDEGADRDRTTRAGTAGARLQPDRRHRPDRQPR